MNKDGRLQAETAIFGGIRVCTALDAELKEEAPGEAEPEEGQA